MDAAAIYAEARLGGSVTLGRRPGVLVVDLSRGFTSPACPVGSDLSGPVAATRTLLDRARGLGLPVVFTTIGFEENLKDAGRWLEKMPGLASLTLGSEWVEIDPRLARRDDEPVVVKKGASAFFGTNVASILLAQRVDTVVLCGATTSGCIRASAVDLLQLGWPALVPRECVGDRARAPHDANLFDIAAKYANVVGLDETLAYLDAVTKEDAWTRTGSG